MFWLFSYIDNTANNFFVHAFQSPYATQDENKNYPKSQNQRKNDPRSNSSKLTKGNPHEARLKAAIEAKERIYGRQTNEPRKITTMPK